MSFVAQSRLIGIAIYSTPSIAAEFTKTDLTPSLAVGLLPVLYFCLVPSYFSCMPKCPTCGKPVEWKDNPWRPFCSERCKLIDFDKWTSEEYRVPGRQINPSEMPAQHSQSDVDNEDEES